MKRLVRSWISDRPLPQLSRRSLRCAHLLNSFEKRHKNMPAHCSPAFVNVKEGDIVTIGQCRPLSKTVRFNVVSHEPAVNAALNVKKQFRIF